MSKLYAIGDTHLGHNNIAKYRPRFATNEEHDDYILSILKETLRKRDTCYFLGDIAFTKEALLKIKSIVCMKKVLVMGNHDAERHGVKMADLLEVFDQVCAMTTKKGCWLTHAPIHPDELRGKFNIHGHTHNHNLNDSRYANVSCENIDYKPIDLLEVKAFMERGEIMGGADGVEGGLT